MHFVNCAAFAAVMFTTLIENLKLCSSAEAGFFLICAYILSKTETRVLIILFL